MKIKGIRIEMDEVAAALGDTGWPVVCVLSGGDHLVAVIERHGGAAFAQREVTEALALRLESQAIPKIFHLVDEMPRNENGKIDRRAVAALLDPGQAAAPVA